MILGATRTGSFTRPAGANPNFQPKVPGTGFFSHFNPFPMAGMMPMATSGGYLPSLQAGAGPVPMPSVPGPVPSAPVAATVPKAGGTAGFGGMGFGSTGGVRGGGHSHVDPYMVMRQGVIPGVSPSGSNIRQAVRGAGARVQRSMPFQTAALTVQSAPAVPAAVAPMVPGAAPALKGFAGPRKRRSWISRMISPETASEQMACETIGPRGDGLFVTICNGQVVSYRDAQGNVRQVG